MPVDEDDNRKVQTAVAGRAGSDEPVFMPFDTVEFDRFISRYPARDFYCGVLLGGCGKKLSAKRYTDKKCHFAHHPPVRCNRTATSESSADHLYIGQALKKWFAQQKQSGCSLSHQPSGHRPGEVVDLAYSSGRRLVRVQLARRSKAQWEAADAGLAISRDHVEWLFGPDSMVANWQIEHQGYALRVQCRTVGATRVVEVGTQFPDQPVEWISLSECRLTARGIVTPSLVSTPQGIVPKAQAAEAVPTPSGVVAFPLAPKTIAFTGAVPVANQLPGPDGTRRLYDVDAQPLGSTVVRARVSLPGDAVVPSADRVYLLQGGILSPLSVPDAPHLRWWIKADGIRPLEGKAAAQWGALHPPAAPPKARPVPAPVVPAQIAAEPIHTSPVPNEAQIIASFRKTLESTARSCGVVKMATLADRAGVPSDGLTPERWRDLLLAIERPHTTDKPVLSALIKGPGGGPAPFFADILTALGWPKNLPEAQLLAVCEHERRRAHDVYRSQARAAATPVPAPTVREPVTARPRETDANRLQAALDALIDQAREAQRANDPESVEQITRRIEQIVSQVEQLSEDGPVQEVLGELTAWAAAEKSASTRASSERLSSLLDVLDEEGDDLLADELRERLRQAEELAESIGDQLSERDRRHIDQWHDHLARMVSRPALKEIWAYAAAIRPLLVQVDRDRRTTTWSELGRLLDSQLIALHPDDKVAVLVEVDRETPMYRPLLSALVCGRDGRPHPLYRRVLFNLNRPVPLAAETETHWQTELRRHTTADGVVSVARADRRPGADRPHQHAKA